MADPLDALRLPEASVSPNRAFAAQLRRRLTDLLDPPLSGGMVTITEPTARTGLHLRPYLVVDGADRAIEFYATVFGARVVGDIIRSDDGRVGHSELEIDGNGFFLADAYPEYGIPAPDPAVGVSLHLEVADADAVVTRAVGAGAIVLQPVEDRFYGSRSGTVRDPFGHQWQIDAPGTVSSTVAQREQEMAESGFVYETIDLAERLTIPGSPSAEAPSVGYFTVDAPDGARAATFYGALFGWNAQAGSEPDGFHVDNIDPPGGIQGATPAAGVTIYFRVSDMAVAVAKVRRLGGTVLEEATYGSGGSARCLDDQGVPFQLWEPAPGY